MADSDDLVSIKVRDSDSNVIIFKLKKTSRMGKIFAHYSAKRGIQHDALRFLLDGHRIEEDATPAGLDSRTAT